MAEQIGSNRARFSSADINAATGTDNRFAGEVCGVQTDSRRIGNGNLFVALRGEKFDGHKFLQQVAAQGAVAALVEEQQNVDLPQIVVPDTLKALGDLARFHRQRFDIPIVAVTGSYGKTSTRALIHAALSAGGETLTSQANFNNEIGLPMTLLQLDKGHKFAVLEMGMRGLKQIDYLAKIALPTVGVITNIGPQHIELLGSLENIALSKAELIENLPADGLAVTPADSPFLPMLKGKAPSCVVTFGADESADYRVTDVTTGDDGNVSFAVTVSGGACALFQTGAKKNSRLEESASSAPVKFAIKLPIPGAHNALNAAAAFAVAHQLGVAPNAIVAALASAQLPGARMRVIKTEQITIIDDCYNAGPDSMRAALQTLRDFPSHGRRVAVLGAMRELGKFSDDEHRKLGELAGEICDFVVGVGNETQPMMDAIRDGDNNIFFGWSAAADAATPLVLAQLQAGDVVLVKGSRSVGLERVVEALKAIE